MNEEFPGLRVQVQVVLYKNEPEDIWRLLWGLSAAMARASDEIKIAVNLALGDCSPTPVITSAEAEALRVKALDEGFLDVTYEFFNENLGSSGGHNRLALRSDNTLLLVLNPDTYPAPDMLLHLISALNDPKVAIAEARQIPIEHPKDYDQATGDTSWASTCCVLVRRTTFDTLGGFDHTHFPLYCDDVDFSWRARLLGQRVLYVPRAVVFHNKSISLSGHVVPGTTELYHSTLARLMLATRYDRRDILKETITWVENHGEQIQKDALDDYRNREKEGRIPQVIEKAETVAQFKGGEYARHRF
jgi:GT2 family glycosyltransferase